MTKKVQWTNSMGVKGTINANKELLSFRSPFRKKLKIWWIEIERWMDG